VFYFHKKGRSHIHAPNRYLQFTHYARNVYAFAFEKRLSQFDKKVEDLFINIIYIIIVILYQLKKSSRKECIY